MSITHQQFYLYLGGSIIRVDLNTLEYETLDSGVSPESCMVSADGRLAAWQQEDSLYESETVSVMNLETGTRKTVSAREGFYIQALGFMGTDFIYGEAAQGDVWEDIAGSRIFPMGRVVIQDQHGEQLRASDYEALGKYVVSISIEDNRISLDCVQRSADGGYEEAAPETITSRELDTEEKISLETRNSGDKKREYYFALAEGHGSGKLRQLSPEQVLFEGSRKLALETEAADERYYAYSLTAPSWALTRRRTRPFWKPMMPWDVWWTAVRTISGNGAGVRPGWNSPAWRIPSRAQVSQVCSGLGNSFGQTEDLQRCGGIPGSGIYTL